jgi:large subunit ribosomal protein L5
VAKKEKKQKKQQAEEAPAAEEKAQATDPKGSPVPEGYEPRLLALYREKVAGELMKQFGYSSRMQLPRVEKVVLNVGIGDAHQEQKLLDSVLEELAIISGQRPVVTRARKSISNFKLREGMQVGARVTLRRWRMWEFLDRLFNLAAPRIRDFRGLPDKSFDGRGNYTIGIKEQIVFPEIDYDKVEKIHGMDITIVTSAQNDEEARALLSQLGCPFRKRQEQPAA